MKEISNRLVLGFAFVACLTGISLRLVSFTWNNTLYGDINLFALTAREFALHGYLDYPMKYEYSNQVDYLTLHTPASQHPPLWPVLAGGIAKIFASDDTFSILKILSEISGLLLIGLMVFFRGKILPCEQTIVDKSISKAALLACSLVSLSAVLIDFSANGSPYILLALWLTLDSWLLLRFDPQKITHVLMAGIFCVLGFLTHNSLLFLPLCFLVVILSTKSINNSRRSIYKSRIFQVFVFLLVFFTGLLPWLIWNTRQFGQALYTYSSYYFFERLGLVETGITDGIITSQLAFSLPVIQLFQRYIITAAKSFYAFCHEFILVTSPFGIFLFIMGIYQGMKSNRRKLIFLLLPAVAYILTIVLWATYKFRFIVPMLPVFFLLTAIGFVAAYQWGKTWRWIACICLMGTLVWQILPLFRQVKTLYYGEESQSYAELYAEMKPLASSLATMPQGVVLGYAQHLDGGIETVYWHRFPFVAGRDLGKQEIIKLARDFKIRYVWVDSSTLASVKQWFPSSRLINRSREFAILELPNQN